MRRKNQLYEVEIKSKAISDEGMGSLVTYYQGGNKKTILMNIKKEYPQYTKREDKPVVNITPITYRQYEERKKSNLILHKRKLVQGHTTRLMEAANETLGN